MALSYKHSSLSYFEAHNWSFYILLKSSSLHEHRWASVFKGKDFQREYFCFNACCGCIYGPLCFNAHTAVTDLHRVTLETAAIVAPPSPPNMNFFKLYVLRAAFSWGAVLCSKEKSTLHAVTRSSVFQYFAITSIQESGCCW